jgi:predicted DCC family thiol-disulfide oxidoreductase YuxK
MNYLLYDGECPLCSRYVRMARLRDALPGFELIDARKRPDLVAEHRSAGREINYGMILSIDGQNHHGAVALNHIALLSTPSRLANRINVRLFRSPLMSRALYPFMVAGRNGLVRLLGRARI